MDEKEDEEEEEEVAVVVDGNKRHAVVSGFRDAYAEEEGAVVDCRRDGPCVDVAPAAAAVRSASVAQVWTDVPRTAFHELVGRIRRALKGEPRLEEMLCKVSKFASISAPARSSFTTSLSS